MMPQRRTTTPTTTQRSNGSTAACDTGAVTVKPPRAADGDRDLFPDPPPDGPSPRDPGPREREPDDERLRSPMPPKSAAMPGVAA